MFSKSFKYFAGILIIAVLFVDHLSSQPKSIDQLKNELELAESRQDQVSVYKNLISRYMRINTDSMYYFAKEFLNLAESSGEDSLLIEAYYNMGRYYAVKGESDQAINYLEKTYDLKDAEDSKDFLGQVVGMMGYVYYFNQQYETAIEFYKEAISYFEQSDSKRSLSIAISTLGSIYFQKGDFSSAKSQYQSSLKIKEELGDSLLMSTDITNLGLIYQREEKLDSALIYANKALEIDKSMNNRSGMADIYGDMSSIYRTQRDYQSAIEYANKSLELSKEVNSFPLIRDAYEVQSKVYEQSGDYENALLSYINFKAYSDSVVNIQTRNELAEAQTRYETEKKDREIELLEAENNTKNLQVLIIVLIAVFGIGFISITYWQTSKRKAREKKAEIESVQKELSNYGVLLAEKDALLNSIIEKLKELSSSLKTFEAKKELNNLIDKLSQSVQLVEDENQLFQRIEQVNAGFFKGLEQQFENLSKNEKRLASLVEMELSNKEISGILGINPRSVVQARYRLKKKLELGTEEDLVAYLKTIGK